jgi:hypothetical protein
MGRLYYDRENQKDGFIETGLTNWRNILEKVRVVLATRAVEEEFEQAGDV